MKYLLLLMLLLASGCKEIPRFCPGDFVRIKISNERGQVVKRDMGGMVLVRVLDARKGITRMEEFRRFELELCAEEEIP